jgi:hypothetical protein
MGSRRWLTLLAAGLLGAGVAGAGDPGKLDSVKAQSRLEELRARLEQVGQQDREKLRLDLPQLQHQAAGTPAAREAAKLVMQLPSPLDTLSAASIPKQERTVWLPKEVVTVLGSQRDRSWGGSIDEVVVSRNGKYLITGSYDALRLWDGATFEEVMFNLRDADSIRALALSPDDRTLVVFAERFEDDGKHPKTFWQVWNVTAAALKLRSTFPGPVPPYRMSHGELRPMFLPDNKTILVRGEDSLELWDISAEPPVKRKAIDRKELDAARSGALSEDGTTLVVLSGGKDFKEKKESSKERESDDSARQPGEDVPQPYLTFWDLRKDVPPPRKWSCLARAARITSRYRQTARSLHS